MDHIVFPSPNSSQVFFPISWVFAHELRNNGENRKRIQRQDCVAKRELGRDVEIVGGSLGSLRYWNFAGGEVWKRGVSCVKGKGTSLADGNVNAECPVEIRMKPVQPKESIGACFGEIVSPAHISGIFHGEKALQKPVY